jgi:hypothetical protein
MLLPLNIPPGVYRNGTGYQAKGRYYDADRVRWIDGTLRPMGGYRARSATALTGKARAMLTWRDNAATRRIAVGTHSKLYFMNEAGAVTDIGPLDLVAGMADATQNIGYGSGLYGAYAYGTPRPDLGVYTPATQWTMDTWGEYLLACSSADGRLLEWQLNTAVKAAPLSGAPTSCRALVVTDERFVFALAAGGNPRKVQWSDQENNASWTPLATNQAGDIELQTHGQLMCGQRVGGGVLLLTDVDAHFATYQGAPYVYGFQRVESGCGVVSQQAAAVTQTMVAWMGRDNFYTYEGFVRPLPSDVSDYVFSGINRGQVSKVHAVHNPIHGEIIWLYPRGTEVDSYVIWNYRENHWNIGSLARTCAAPKGTFANPLMVGSDGLVYEHEVGLDHGGVEPFAETGPLELDTGTGPGGRVMMIRGLIPDERTAGDVTASFFPQYYPNGPETPSGEYPLRSPTSMRITGRQVRVRYTGARLADWRVGVNRLDLAPGGGR